MTNVPVTGSSSQWKRYKHSSSEAFTLEKITHSDVLMEGGGLTANMNKTIGTDGAIYVYYDNNGANLNQPKVICISTGPPNVETNNKWYTAGSHESNWSFQSGGIGGKKNPTEVTAADLDTAGGSTDINIDTSTITLTIKLDKRPGTTGNIQYITKGTDVSVEKKDTGIVPSGYTAYIHEVTIPASNKIILQHNGNKLKEVAESQTVSKIFVYYKDGDSDYKFPLIVCVKKEGNSQTYYTRGQTWSEGDPQLNGVDPDDASAGNKDGQLANALNDLKNKYEIDIGKTDTSSPNRTYKASAAGGQITVAKVIGDNNNGVPTDYVRYTHMPSDTKTTPTFNLGLVKYNGHVLDGINTTTGVTAVYVYYSDSDEQHEFPLIVCVLNQGGSYKYYKRGNEWTIQGGIDNGPEEDGVKDQLNQHLPVIIQQYEVKLEKDDKNGGKYIARPGTDEADKISVTAVGPDIKTEFKGFRHRASTVTTFNVNRITIHGQVITDIPQTDIDQFTFNDGGGVFVYFPLNSKSNPDLEKPLLICLSQDGGTTNNKWYKYKRDKDKCNTWENVPSEYDEINPGSNNTIDSKLVPKLDEIKYNLQPYSGIAKLFGIGDDDGYHRIHWSPIFMLSLSLGTVYAFYPAISPYQLVDDPFDGKKIELWIQAVSATPHIAFAITNLCNLGPGRTWKKKAEGDSATAELYALYHLVWLCIIPYVMCIYIFFSVMHFPDGRIAKYFKENVIKDIYYYNMGYNWDN